MALDAFQMYYRKKCMYTIYTKPCFYFHHSLFPLHMYYEMQSNTTVTYSHCVDKTCNLMAGISNVLENTISLKEKNQNEEKKRKQHHSAFQMHKTNIKAISNITQNIFKHHLKCAITTNTPVSSIW